MICIQLKIKCKIILLKTLENGLNKSYLMTYQSSFLFIKFSPPLPYIGKDWGPSRVFEFPFRGGLLPGVALGSTFRVSFSASCSANASKAYASTIFVLLMAFLILMSNWKSLS